MPFSATLPLLTFAMLMEWWLTCTTIVKLLPFAARSSTSIAADASFAVVPSDISVVVLLTETAATSGLDSSGTNMLLMLLSPFSWGYSMMASTIVNMLTMRTVPSSALLHMHIISTSKAEQRGYITMVTWHTTGRTIIAASWRERLHSGAVIHRTHHFTTISSRTTATLTATVAATPLTVVIAPVSESWLIISGG
uniref:Putative secreted protein n=1 Tax=Anopheles triannulatus TaxID=58253 RepID=A0A2M4B2N1_9DIPT